MVEIKWVLTEQEVSEILKSFSRNHFGIDEKKMLIVNPPSYSDMGPSEFYSIWLSLK